MKKFLVLSVMLFSAVTSFAQALPGVLSIKDALTIGQRIANILMIYKRPSNLVKVQVALSLYLVTKMM